MSLVHGGNEERRSSSNKEGQGEGYCEVCFFEWIAVDPVEEEVRASRSDSDFL